MPKAIKIILKILGGILLFLIMAIVAIPLLFKDELIETVRRAVDQHIEGALYFDKADVGLLRSFPDLSVNLTNPVLTGGAHPSGDSLLTASGLEVRVDILSAIRKDAPLRVTGLRLQDPKISLFTDADGNTNYDLVTPDSTETPSTDSSSVEFEISDYEIRNGSLKYIDQGTKVVIRASGLEHAGSLHYAGDIVDLKSSTKGGLVTLAYDGITYLDEVEIRGKNDLHLDLAQSRYTFIDNILSVNALNFDLDGVVATTESTTDFDLTFDTKRSSFKGFLSLLPGLYTEDFDAIQASGNLAFSGSLKGQLSESQVPIYQVLLKIDDGAFQYPDKPLGFAQVNLSAHLRNASPDWGPEEIDIQRLHFLLNNQPFDAHARIIRPSGNGTFQGAIKGILDLADLSRAYPMDKIDQLAGRIDADVQFDVIAGRPIQSQVVLGQLKLSHVAMRTGNQSLSVEAGNIHFTPARIEINTTAAAYQQSPLALDLTLGNPVGWLTDNQMLEAGGAIRIGQLDLDALTTPTGEDLASEAAGAPDSSLSMIRYALSFQVDTLIYDNYVIHKGSARIDGTLNHLDIPALAGEINDTRFNAKGAFDGIDHYLDGDAPLRGTLALQMDKVYVNQWIEDSDAAGVTADSAQYIALPSDIALDLTFAADAAYYDDIDIANPRGHLVLNDQVLELQHFEGKAMGGNIAFSGLYDSRDIVHPGFNLKYDLSSLKFHEAFAEIRTLRILAPIIQYVEGVFNSTLVMEGKLGKDYLPDYNTLAASGFIETLQGKLQQTEILDKLSQFLNLKKPLQLDLTNTRNWFEVKDGFVILQEASKTIDGIEIAYGGRHHIQGAIDYLIKLNLPADQVTTNPVGALAKSGYEELQKQAGQYGIRLQTIDRFIVHVGITGKLSDPKFSIRLFDASGKTLKDAASDQLTEVSEQVRDTLSSIANEKLDEAKDSLKSLADQAVDSAKILAEQQARELIRELTEQAAQELDSTVRDSLTNAALEKAREVLGDDAGKDVDKIKDALDKWDPFKKKKKN